VPATTLPTATDGRGAFQLAELAVRAAGEIITASLPQMSFSVSERNVHVANKSGWNDIVTDIDHAAEEAMLSILHSAFANDSILAEESGTRNGTSGYSWCIDPLDGTRNFASGIPHIGVNLALLHAGRIILGLTYDPVRNELFHAIEGGGAFLNGKQISISEQTELHECVLGADMSYKAHEGKLLLTMLADLWPGVQAIRMMDSAALGLAYAAAGRFEIFINHFVQPWDIAPGILLLREAGGVTTDLRGDPAHPTSGCIIAASPKVHAKFLLATAGSGWRGMQI
jgi:myo-inositol-1(or 4)-monophosphatase